MKLECYALIPEPPALVPARATRKWMDATHDRFAYRCLPLNIANGYGWEILSPHSFSIPGWDLLATGPANDPKDGIAPLTGVIETDWLPFPFTMNWRLTRPGEVRFEKGEPFCMIAPVQRGTLEATQPEILDIHDYPELVKEYEAWKSSRIEFLEKLKINDEQTVKQAWQRFYFKGQAPGRDDRIPYHASKMRLAAPVDKRKKKPAPRAR